LPTPPTRQNKSRRSGQITCYQNRTTSFALDREIAQRNRSLDKSFRGSRPSFGPRRSQARRVQRPAEPENVFPSRPNSAKIGMVGQAAYAPVAQLDRALPSEGGSP
jgi:hypothetical protein